MIAQRSILLTTCLFLAMFFHADAWAQAIKDWKGQTNNSQWNEAANWEPAGVPAPADIVRIGVVASNQSTITISTDVFCAAMEFGSFSNVTLNINTPGRLTSAGAMIIDNKPNAVRDARFAVDISGSGTLNTGSIQVGNDQKPADVLNGRSYTRLNMAVAEANISGDLIMNSVSDDVDGTYYPEFYLYEGTLTLNGQIDSRNKFYYLESFPANSVPQYRSMFRCYDVSTTAVLILKNTEPIKPLAPGHCIDFTDNASGFTTIVYENTSLTPQIIYPYGQVPVGQQPSNYKKIEFRGAGPKIMAANPLSGANSITIGNSWVSEGGKVDLTTNITTIEFAGGNQTIRDNSSDNGAGVTFRNITLSGSGTKTLTSSGSRFGIAANGILRNSRVFATNNLLTLKSDAGSSATVSALSSGARIDGLVAVERFIKGSNTDLTKRGYRLISSPVSTITVGGLRLQDYNYLTNSVPVSGLAGGGFNVTGNPTLYLYREDITPSGISFTSSNYKGIAKINNTNTYDIGTQKRFTTTNVNDTLINVPAANGTLFFFRGNTTDNNGSAAGSKTVTPFNFPEDVTVTNTGILNQGTVSFRHWFNRPDMAMLSYTSSADINNNTAPRRVRGYNLVGNPYASAINWNKLNRNATQVNSSIYAPLINKSVWFFNPTNKQYEVYLDASPANSDTTSNMLTGTGSASNIIASGQGFFVRATADGGILRFLESGKTNTQPMAASLNKLMGIPVSTVAGIQPYIRIELKKDSLNNDDILIRFDEKGNENYILNEDAEDMGGNGALVSLSSFSGDKKSRLAINCMPSLPAIHKIFLAADAMESGQYQLQRKEFVGAADIYQVWLKDNFTKDSLDFRANDTYTFRISKSNTATFGDNRFELIFRKKLLPPYELLSFTAEKVKEGALLKWKVLNEYAYTQFTIQKADGSQEFLSIGKINSDGEGTYSFTDTKYTGEISAYRILQNKPDGTESFSSVATLKNTLQNGFAVYPNPVQKTFTIQFGEDVPEQYSVKISDAKGRMIYSRESVESVSAIDIGQVKAGMYFIEVRDTKTYQLKGRQKLIKL